ncbi:MAG TPA: MaoC family dehydratase [Streptosporangiaceae bacterium]|nr:MaoC family dehydratase [Streptosporangiaceae bacterium]
MTMIVNGLTELKEQAGADLGASGWLEITQERIDQFADATNDHQWIHVDPVKAADGPFGRTVAHGYLTLSLVVPLFFELLDVKGVKMSINYGLNKVRFPAPVPAGSKIRLAAVLAEVEDVAPNGVQIVADLTVEVEGSGKPACIAQALYRHYA